VQAILLFFILCAISPRLARAFGKLFVLIIALFIGLAILAAAHH
jgi:hypothetical protein